MCSIGSYDALENLGRVRLSKNFFMRDFLYSEISNYYKIPNIPEDPELAIEVGGAGQEEVVALVVAGEQGGRGR